MNSFPQDWRTRLAHSELYWSKKLSIPFIPIAIVIFAQRGQIECTCKYRIALSMSMIDNWILNVNPFFTRDNVRKMKVNLVLARCWVHSWGGGFDTWRTRAPDASDFIKSTGFSVVDDGWSQSDHRNGFLHFPIDCQWFASIDGGVENTCGDRAVDFWLRRWWFESRLSLPHQTWVQLRRVLLSNCQSAIILPRSPPLYRNKKNLSGYETGFV